MRLLTILLVITATFAGCLEGSNEPATTTTPTTTTPTTTPPPTPTTSEGTPPVTSEGDATCVSTKTDDTSAAMPTWVLETSLGTIRMTLYCDKTPITSQNIVKLTEDGYFDGIKFHRVIGGFMNQGGDPLTKDDGQKSRWGTGGPGYTIADEFACADGTTDSRMNDPQYPGRPMRESPHKACNGQLALKHDGAGALSMANAGANSGGSQFFITAAAQPGLDGAHPVFGKTADEASLAVVMAINRVPTDSSDRPTTPVVIDKATIEW